jgi:hypothetical protein
MVEAGVLVRLEWEASLGCASDSRTVDDLMVPTGQRNMRWSVEQERFIASYLLLMRQHDNSPSSCTY